MGFGTWLALKKILGVPALRLGARRADSGALSLQSRADTRPPYVRPSSLTCRPTPTRAGTSGWKA